MIKYLLFIFFLSTSVMSQPRLKDIWPLKGINVEIMNNSLTKVDIAKIQQSGMNLVILNLKFKLYKNKFHLTQKQMLHNIFDEVDKVLDLLAKYNLHGIIAFTHLPNFNTKLKQTSLKFWQSPILVDKIYSLSEQIAKRFANRGDELLAYKFIDEPLVRQEGKNFTPPHWFEIQQGIVRSIRKQDKQRYIVVTSGPGGLGRNYSNWKPLKDSHIIYGAHFFTPHYYTHQGINNKKHFRYPTIKNNKYFLEYIFYTITRFQKTYNVPVMIGSFSVIHGSEGDLQYLNDVINLFDDNNISWAYWCYKGFKGWDINLDTDKTGVYSLENNNSSRWKLVTRKIKGDKNGSTK